MRLRLFETNLFCDECELWHLLAGFLPEGSCVKFRQLLQLGLGECLGIGGDRLLPDTRPTQILRQKHLQDLPLRSELRTVLELLFQDLVGKRLHALIDFHYHEQVLSSCAWLCSSPRATHG